MENHLNIVFSGDLSLTGIFKRKVLNNKEIFDEIIQSKIYKSDLFIANLEGPVYDNTHSDVICQPLNAIDYLANRNIKVFNLANNHIFDFGKEGFNNTIEPIQKKPCSYFGAGADITEASKPLYISKNGITLALIGLSHKEGMIAGRKQAGVFSIKHLHLLKKIAKQAKDNADWVILNFHGGEEYTLYPTPYKRRLLHKMANIAGVDLIIAHHSHTVQGMEKVNNKTVFYSLGNFVFDYKAHNRSQYAHKGILVELKMTKKDYEQQILPVYINKSEGLIEKGEDQFLQHFDKISEFKRYRQKFMKEAYRFINERQNTIQQHQSYTNKKTVPRVFRISFYINLLKKFSDPFNRALFVEGMFYKTIQKLKIK